MIRLFTKAIRRRRCSQQQGIALLEALIAMSLLGIFGLGLAATTVTALKMRRKATYDAIALEIAIEKMEDFAGLNPSSLSDGDNWDETVARSNMNFNLNSSVTVNSNGSRTVYVDVTANTTDFITAVSMDNTFSLWEEQ